MDLKERFFACRDFLAPYSELLSVEILKRHPDPLPDHFSKWIDAIEGFSAEDLAALENERESAKMECPSLKNFLSKISELAEVPSFQDKAPELSKSLLRRVDLKKKHELERMGFLAGKHGPFENVIDIGGGAGHLSSTLVHGKGRRAFCLDRNEKFQMQGRKRLEKWAPENSAKIIFIPCDFQGEIDHPEIKELENHLIVGLHGCGNLTTNIIRYHQKSQSDCLMSVGCCYQDLQGDYNISEPASENGIDFSKNALHLAARCHTVNSVAEMERKIKVRSYRYGLHFYLFEKTGKSFEAIGNTSLEDYNHSFAAYAQKYGKLKKANTLALEAFYEHPDNQKLIRRTILADILRGLLGRVVEMYIVLDRAIFLEEAGQKVELLQAFDRCLSPRNLMILAKR